MVASIKVIIVVTMATAVTRVSSRGDTQPPIEESAESLQRGREIRSAHALHSPLHSRPPWHHQVHGNHHGYHRGHSKKGFSKALKSGFAKGAGYRGKKGFRDKEGYKKKAKGNHGKWRHKGYHDKNGKRYKGRKRIKKYYGDVHKGYKGNKGHQFRTKGHHNKGHKDKGFKNIYHKEEYHHKRKFYDDFNNKKYHNKYDDAVKYIKGNKGSDFKGGNYKGGYHNDTYGATDEKEEGEYHDNDYKFKDHYKHNKYYKDKHKHGAQKGFKGGYDEGYSESHGGFGGQEDHDGHHSHGREQFAEHSEPSAADAGHEELGEREKESEAERDQNQQLSPSQKNPVKVPKDEVRRGINVTRSSQSSSSRHSSLRHRPSYRASPNYQSERKFPHEWDDSSVAKSFPTKHKPDSSKSNGIQLFPAPQNPLQQPTTPSVKTGRRPYKLLLPFRLWEGSPKPASTISPYKIAAKSSPNHRSQREMITHYIHNPARPRKVRKKPKAGVSYSYGRRISSSLIPSYIGAISTYKPQSSHSRQLSPYSALETKLVPKAANVPKFAPHQPLLTNSLKPLFSPQSIAGGYLSFRQNQDPVLKSRRKIPQKVAVLPLPNQDYTNKGSTYQQVKNSNSIVRQSLRYRDGPKAFSLPKPTYDTYQPWSPQISNSSILSLSNKPENISSIGMKYFVSHPDFENFGKFGQPENFSIFSG